MLMLGLHGSANTRAFVFYQIIPLVSTYESADAEVVRGGEVVLCCISAKLRLFDFLVALSSNESR